MNRNSKFLCKCHPDFHLPAEVIVGRGFDGSEYARKARLSGVESLVAFAKCHYGFSYYNTDIGTRHPGLEKDMLEEFVKGCRKEGLGVTCYYSVFLDTAAGMKHNDWLMRENDMPLEELLKTKFLPICVNSGYLEELLLPQVLEIMDRYDIDELFFDTMVNFVPCYCDNCRRLFGRPIPGSGSPYWLEYVNWYHKRYELFFDRILEAIHTGNSGVSAVINWKWSANLPETPVKYIKSLVGDLFTSGSVSSYYSHYWAGTGYPFDYMCGRFLHGLGDWTNNTPETLKRVAASAIANCGGFYLIDRQLPDGSLEDRAYSMMKDVFGFVRERRSVVEDTVHIPETAVLYPLEHAVGPDFEYFPEYEVRTARIRQFKGVAGIFSNNAVHYTAVNTDVLQSRLQEYKLLVLPEVDFLGEAIKAKIKDFVEKGGKLLIVQNSYLNHTDKDILELAGVEHTGMSERDYSYISNESKGIFDPVLVRGKAAAVEPVNGAEILARFNRTLSAGGNDKEFGHGFAPPTADEGDAAIVFRRLGRGEVIYVAAPLFTSYAEFFSPPIASMVMKLYRRLMPEPLVRVYSCCPIEMTNVRKNDDLVVHLVNHSGKETIAVGFPITEHVPELVDIMVSVKAAGDKRKAVSVPEGIIADVREEGGYLKLRMAKLGIMGSICISGYFKE